MTITLIGDCETDGLLPELTKVHCLAFVDLNTGDVQSFADQPGYTPIEEGLLLLQDADVTVWHNAIGFDIKAIRKVYPWWQPKGTIRDSLLTSKLVYPKFPRLWEMDTKESKLPAQLMGRHSLEAWGYRLGKHKGDYKGGWADWSEEMNDYCIQDVVVTLKLWKKLTAELATWRSLECVDIEHEVAWICQAQEERGVAFDKAAAAKLLGQLVSKREPLVTELTSVFPPKTIKVPFVPKRDNKAKGWSKGVTVFKEKTVEFNPLSRDQVAERLMGLGWQPAERTKGGKWKVDDDILNELPYPEAHRLAELYMIEKRIGTLSDGKEALLKHEKNGRIHGRVDSAGAVTGRATHSKPNFNIPKVGTPYGEEFRSLFIASPGNVLVGCDASGLEARVEAGLTTKYDGGTYQKMILSGDKSDGSDIHSRNRAAIKPIVPTITRDGAKTTKYAWTYGAGDWKIGYTAGVTGSKEQISAAGGKIRKRLLAASPGLKSLVEKVGKTLKVREYLIGLDGRRLFIRSKHAALNTLMQSAGAVIFKKAIIIRYQTMTGLMPSQVAAGQVPTRYAFGDKWVQVGWYHDEVLDDVKPEISKLVGRVMARSIYLAGRHFNFACQMAGDFSIGTSWKQVH